MRVCALAAALVAVLGLTACEPSPVLELTVNITDDLVDVAPGDGVCEATAGVGDCSLRAAVMEANATPATSAVRVVRAANAQYVLTRVDDTCSFSETNEVST